MPKSDEYQETRLFLASYKAHKTFMGRYLSKIPNTIILSCGGKIQIDSYQAFYGTIGYFFTIQASNASIMMTIKSIYNQIGINDADLTKPTTQWQYTDKQLCKRSCVSFQKLKELGEEVVYQVQVSGSEFWLPLDIVKCLDEPKCNSSEAVVREITKWIHIAREKKRLHTEECKLPITFPSILDDSTFTDNALVRIYMVVDTNIFLSDFSVIEWFRTALLASSSSSSQKLATNDSSEHERVIEACVCLPQIVTKELDVLQRTDKSECCNGVFIAFSTLTRTVLKRLMKIVEMGSRFFTSESDEERRMSEVACSQMTNLKEDVDEVLQTCLNLGREQILRSSPHSPGFVMLLTNNKNMILTANSLGIVAFTARTFPDELWGLRQACKRSYEMLPKLKDIVGCTHINTDQWEMPISISDDAFEQELERITDQMSSSITFSGSNTYIQQNSHIRQDSSYSETLDVSKLSSSSNSCSGAGAGRQKQSRFFPHITTNLDTEDMTSSPILKSPKNDMTYHQNVTSTESLSTSSNDKTNNPWNKKPGLRNSPVKNQYSSNDALINNNRKAPETNLKKIQNRKLQLQQQQQQQIQQYSQRPSLINLEEYPIYPNPHIALQDMSHVPSRVVPSPHHHHHHHLKYQIPTYYSTTPSPPPPPPPPYYVGGRILNKHQQQLQQQQQQATLPPPHLHPHSNKYATMDITNSSGSADVLSAQILSQLCEYGGNVGDRQLWHTLAQEAVTVVERYLSPVVQYVLQIRFQELWTDHIPTCPPWSCQMLFQMIDNLWNVFSEVFPVAIRALKDEIESLIRRADKEEISAEMLVRLMASIRDLFLMIPKPNIPFIEEEMKHSQIKPVSSPEAVQMLTIGRDEILSLYNSAIRNIQACLTELASKSSNNSMRTQLPLPAPPPPPPPLPPSYGPVYPHEMAGPMHLPPHMAPTMEAPQMVYPMPPPPPPHAQPQPHHHSLPQAQAPSHYIRPYENGHQMTHPPMYQQMPYINPELSPYSNSGWNGHPPLTGHPPQHLVHPDRYIHPPHPPLNHNPLQHPGSAAAGLPNVASGHLSQHYCHLHGSMQPIGLDHHSPPPPPPPPGYNKWDNRVHLTSSNQTIPQQQQQPPPPVHRHYIPH